MCCFRAQSWTGRRHTRAPSVGCSFAAGKCTDLLPTFRIAICVPLASRFPAMPEVVGPFSNYDIRVYAQQNIVDLQSLHGLKASERALDADKLDDQDARDLIVRAIGALYLNAESAAARAKAAQSRVNDSMRYTSWPKTSTMRERQPAWMYYAPRCNLANDKQALLIAQNDVQARAPFVGAESGHDPGHAVGTGRDAGVQTAGRAAALKTLVPEAVAARADYQSLAAQRQALVEQQRANRARSYPKLSINGNFGGIGRSIGGIQADRAHSRTS